MAHVHVVNFNARDDGFVQPSSLARASSKNWEQTQSAPELPLLPARSSKSRNKTFRRLKKIDDALSDLYAASSQLADDSKALREDVHHRRERVEKEYHIDSSAPGYGKAPTWPNVIDLGPLKAAIQLQVSRQPVALLIPAYKKSRLRVKERKVVLDEEGHFPALPPPPPERPPPENISKLLAPTKSFAAKVGYQQAISRAGSKEPGEGFLYRGSSNRPVHMEDHRAQRAAAAQAALLAARASPSPPRQHFLKPMAHGRPEAVRAF